MAKLAHGIEKMRYHGGACIHCGHGDLVGGAAVTEADNHAGIRQRPDLVHGNRFRGNSGQKNRHFLHRLDEGKEIGIVHWPDQFGIVRALVCQGKVRPFNVQSDETRNLFLRSGPAGGECRGRDLRRIGDQGREHGGGAEGKMRIAYGADDIDAWAVVEKHAAAAIDLDVDEAGNELATFQRDLAQAGIQVRIRGYAFDKTAVNDERRIGMPVLAVEYLGASECVW